MEIRLATKADVDWLAEHDRHISKPELRVRVSMHNVLMAWEGDTPIGWLRWNLFWDNTPFMNMLYVLEEWRGQGVGRALVNLWEAQEWARGHALLLTSTQADESAQHFYRRLGYQDAGALLLPGETTELFFVKTRL